MASRTRGVAVKPRYDAETINRFEGQMSERLFQAALAGAVHVSAEHIGQSLGIPTGTAKSRLHRANARIAALLAAEATPEPTTEVPAHA